MFFPNFPDCRKRPRGPRSTKLGYSGLVVRISQQADREVYIQNGIIELSDQTSLTFFLDRERSLERWSIETGKKFLRHEVLEAIERDLRK